MRNSLIILFLLIATSAFGEEYVCHVNGTITEKHFSVDGSDLDIRPECIKIKRSLFRSLTRFYLVENNLVREMTQIEKDALLLAEANAQAAAKTQRESDIDSEINSININDISLPLVDAEINALGVSQDVKDFLKKFVRYVVTRSNL